MSTYLPEDASKTVSLSAIYAGVGGYDYGFDDSKDTLPVLSGAQKASQRFCRILQSRTEYAGSLFPDVGTDLVQSLLHGSSSNFGYMLARINFAAQSAVDQMSADDANTELFGPTPDDEKVVGLRNVTIARSPSGAVIEATLVLASNTDEVVYIPLQSLQGSP